MQKERGRGVIREYRTTEKEEIGKHMTKQQKKKLDVMWQQIITSGQCSYAGCNMEGSEGHHIFKRRYLNTRWLIENGRRLCREHHLWADTNPEAYEDLIVEEIGQEAYDSLRQKAYMIAKQYYDEILKELKEKGDNYGD